MRDKLRLLGILPFAYMKPLMLQVLEDFPQIEMDVYVGHMEHGVSRAKEAGLEKYDAIVSRGDTAQLLESLSLPVVSIQFSDYDILCTLQRIQGGTAPLAMVGSPAVITSARNLCTVLGYTNLDFYVAEKSDNMAQQLRIVKSKNYGAVVCDSSVDIMSRRMGMSPILIASGAESLRQTLRQALLLHKDQQRLQAKSELLDQVLQGHPNQVAVMDSNGHLVYSSLPPKLEQVAMTQSNPGKTVRTLEGSQYVLRTKRIVSRDQWYTACYAERRKLPGAPSREGITILSEHRVAEALDESAFSFSTLTHELLPTLKGLLHQGAVVLNGEPGTGAPPVVYTLYLESTPSLSSLVAIDCSALGEKSWTFLIHHPNSPLMDNGSLLYFTHLDALSLLQRQSLCTALSEGQIHRRNQVIFDCTCPWDCATSPVGVELANTLCCQMFYLPPLRQLKSQIPAMVQLVLSHLNMRHTHLVLSVEEEAMALLQSFPWPYNYIQLRRVMERLVFHATSSTLTAAQVRTIIQQEEATSNCSNHAGFGVDLRKSLDELSKDIALQVLQETKGNQTAAAKRLGISRTTFWRLVRNQ